MTTLKTPTKEERKMCQLCRGLGMVIKNQGYCGGCEYCGSLCEEEIPCPNCKYTKIDRQDEENFGVFEVLLEALRDEKELSEDDLK